MTTPSALPAVELGTCEVSVACPDEGDAAWPLIDLGSVVQVYECRVTGECVPFSGAWGFAPRDGGLMAVEVWGCAGEFSETVSSYVISWATYAPVVR